MNNKRDPYGLYVPTEKDYIEDILKDKHDLYEENKRLWRSIYLIGAQCGLPDPADACRAILATIRELDESDG